MKPARAMVCITLNVRCQTVCQSLRSPPHCEIIYKCCCSVDPRSEEDMINNVLKPCWQVFETNYHATEAKQAIMRDESKLASLVMHHGDVMEPAL